MKPFFRTHVLPLLWGAALGLLVAAATARAQSVLPGTVRTLAGPAYMNGITCPTTVSIYQDASVKKNMCVTLQDLSSSVACAGCTVSVSLQGAATLPPVSASVNVGESTTLCAKQILSVTTACTGAGTATYQWRIDSY